ncbi:MAG: hypothetical protein LBG63_05245 [Candidatus Methanoplasma sp.]|jgi:hypothetical protein|nr:hypothetical protein [Candidatus Methanoplasma sp.]
MVAHNNENKNKMFEKRPILKYGMLALVLLVASAIVVQVVPGGTEDTAAADVSINLDNNIGSGTGYSWSGTTLTINGNNNTYTITQSISTVLERKIVVPYGVSSVTVKINGINIRGDVEIQCIAPVKLLLAGTNVISGSILLPKDSTITIDSADSTNARPGNVNGTLNVTASVSAYAGIGGSGTGDGSGGTITINGGTVNAIGGQYAAGIGGGGNGGGTVVVGGGTVTATGGGGAAGIGGGNNGSGTVTIRGGTVTAVGGAGGAGISGGSNGGGTVTIAGGTVTAVGGSGGAGIGGGQNGGGGTITVGSNTTIKAYSVGRPAIHASSISSASTGYFVNLTLGTDLPSGASSILVYAYGTTNTVLATLTPPDSNYRGFAFTLPNSTSSKHYSIFVLNSEGQRPILRASDSNPDIYSIKGLDNYNVYNSNANNGILPVKLDVLTSAFVAVTDVFGVPASVTIGKPLTLSGAAVPSNATNQPIVWTVKNAGTTGATISDNVLSATDEGTVVITATITNGTATGTSFVKDFNIAVSVKEKSSGGGDSGPSMWMWVGMVIAIIILLAITVSMLRKGGVIRS